MDTETGGSTAVELTRRLFVPAERWGWEYVDPGRGRANPHSAREPRWEEPPPPDTTPLESRRQDALARLPRRLVLPTILILIDLLWLLWVNGDILLLLIGTAIAAVYIVPIVLSKKKIENLQAEGRQRREQAWQQHQAALAAWQADVHAYEIAEEQRREQADLFFPLGPQSAPPRVDVFGGTGDGWASLLATTGASVLAGGTGILLLDLSERGIGGGLAVLADAAGCPVEVHELPADMSRLPLLADLPPGDVAEALADALDTARASDSARGAGESQALRALDAELLGTVAHCLDGPPTFGRLAAGLRVLARLGDPTGQPMLSQAEVGRILGRVDAIGSSPKVTDELQFLRMSLDVLAGDPGNAGSTGGYPPGIGPQWWPVRGLRIIATSSRDTTTRRKDLTDRVLFQVVLHQLRRRRGSDARDMVVVAGADHLGRAALEAFARHAEISGIRLAYMFERIAADSERFLGGHGSTSVIMRMGHAREAAAAAEFIGRGHSFVLSQVTEQVGRSFTTSEGVSRGGSESFAETEGTFGSRDGSHAPGMFSRLLNTDTTKGWNRSVTVSRSTTWERTRTISEGDQVNRGRILQRSYEFTVEPTVIQQLPPTAFVLVDAAAGARRAVIGDCNPGIVLLPRVSDRPYLPGAEPGGPSAIVGGHTRAPLGAATHAGLPPGYDAQPDHNVVPTAGYGQPGNDIGSSPPTHPPYPPAHPGAGRHGRPGR